jgi:hypothetical protein
MVFLGKTLLVVGSQGLDLALQANDEVFLVTEDVVELRDQVGQLANDQIANLHSFTRPCLRVNALQVSIQQFHQVSDLEGFLRNNGIVVLL